MDKKQFLLKKLFYDEGRIVDPEFGYPIGWSAVVYIPGSPSQTTRFCPAMRTFWKLNKISYDHRIYVGTLAKRESGSEFEIFKIRDYQDQAFEKWNIFLII